MIKRIVLVIPPQLGLLDGFANGVISLANFLKTNMPELDVCTLDLGITPDHELQETISEVLTAPGSQTIIGISTTTASYQNALKTARIFRQLSKDALVVFGGHHASAQAREVLESHRGIVDAVVHGEGEVALQSLIENAPNLSTVSGISFISATGKVRRNFPAKLLADEELDSIAPNLLGGDLRSAPGKFEHTTYVSARGCPLKCSFCSEAGQEIRAKSVPAVVADIKQLVTEHGYRNIAIEDNFFAHSRKRTMELCQGLETLRSEIEFAWDCQTRVESLDRRGIIDAMERAGCTAVYIGVESLNGEHLGYLGKTRNPASYVERLKSRVVPALMESKIDCYINLQLGLPGESKIHRRENLLHLADIGRTALEAGKKVTVFPQLHVVYPGTQHFKEAVEQKRFGPDSARIFERFTSWEADQKPIFRWLGEHFAHGVGGIPEGILKVDTLRKGQFEVDSNRVLNVSTYLRRMEETPGIEVFRYGRYLAHTDSDLNAAEASAETRKLNAISVATR